MAQHPMNQLNPLYPIDSLGNILSYELILNILKQLEFEDRVRASCTCRQWRKVSYDPSLWRTLGFTLPSRDLSRVFRSKVVIRSLKTLGRHIRTLAIDFPEINQQMSRCLAKNLHMFLFGLSWWALGTSTLKEIAIVNLYMDERCHPQDSAKFGLVRTLSKFLRCQQNLESIYLPNLLAEDFLGSTILESLSRSASLRQLQNLDLSYFYNSNNVVADENIELLRNVLGSCLSLRSFTINISLLRAVSVDFVCQTLVEKLKYLNIIVSEGFDLPVLEVEGREYKNSWILSGVLCPQLEVYLHFFGEDLDGNSFVVPGMRLVSLDVSVVGPQNLATTYGTKISQLLNRVTQCCSESLREMYLYPWSDSDFHSVLSEESVVSCLTTCTKIRKLSISNAIYDLELLATIRNIFGQKFGNNVRMEEQNTYATISTQHDPSSARRRRRSV